MLVCLISSKVPHGLYESAFFVCLFIFFFLLSFLFFFFIFGLGSLNFDLGISGREHRNGGLKNCVFCFCFLFCFGLVLYAKVRSTELKIFNILRAYELKFEPNLGHRAKSSFNFWKISAVGVKFSYFSLKVGSKELNDAASRDLKSSGRGKKRRSWLPDIPVQGGGSEKPNSIRQLLMATSRKCSRYQHTYYDVIWKQSPFKTINRFSI